MSFSDIPKLVARMTAGIVYTESEEAEMRIDPYAQTPKYARAALYFLCVGTFVFGVGNLLPRLRHTKTGSRLASTMPARRATAAARFVASSQPRTVGFIRFPTVGVIILITAFWLFIGIWSFAQQPYYRSSWNVGSPPLAMRTGLFALGCFPFILAFGAKWNLVTFVTGYSHEKLQVFHQWLSHLFLVLSLLHTFPFVVQGTHEIRPNTDGLNPHGYSQLYYSWHVSHNVFYWSGIAALVPLAWLCWGSFAPLRNRFYELFKLLHVISAILFSAFFYIHCNKLLTSWGYLYATVAIYGFSLIMRFGLIFLRHGQSIPRGTLIALPSDAVRLTIPLPAHHLWSAGQHYFLNFISASPFESHPYTISNTPHLHSKSDADARERTMVVVLRINPKVGLGPKLLGLAESGRSTVVLLDGPYGGLGNARIGRYETVLLLAGGAGASFITALLEEVCEGIAKDESGVVTSRVDLIWAVRDEEAKVWFEEQISASMALVPEGTVNVHLFVTGARDEKLPGEKSSRESSTTDLKHSTKWDTTYDRPDLASIVTSALTDVPAGSSVGIGSCGPKSFTLEVRNAVAARQKMIMLGKSGGVGAEDVELFTEEFDW